MTRIAGNKKLKRQMAPVFWGLDRKNKRFAITVNPGPHKKNHSIPIAVLLRDKLKLASTLRECKSVIYNGKIIIDGITRKSLHHGVGLMDIVELNKVLDIYRLIPVHGKMLSAIKIPKEEKYKKIIKIISKNTIKKNKIQIGSHDGRSIITDLKVNVGDSCLITVPQQEILHILKLEKNCKILIIRGTNAGKTGTIDEIKNGTFLLPKQVTINLGNNKIEIPLDIVMVVGKDKPVLTIE